MRVGACYPVQSTVTRPIKKPWRCSSNNPKMLTFLDEKCLGNHTHAECGGEGCKASGNYTLEIIDALRMGFSLRCGPSSQNIIASRDGRIYIRTRENTIRRRMSCLALTSMETLLPLVSQRHIVRVIFWHFRVRVCSRS
jgi:hypothetical protein